MTDYGSAALDYAAETIEPYLYATAEQRDLAVLWAAHTHVFSHFAVTPRISVRSNGPGEGKTTFLEIVKALSHHGESTGHATGASLYNLIHEEHPTLCLDEVDNLFSATGFSRANPTLQAVLNDGYTSEGSVRAMRSGRSVQLSVFTPVLFCGIGALPAAMSSRAIPVMMKKGTPDEVFDPIIEGVYVREARDVIADWLRDETSHKALRSAPRRPEIPGLDDPRSRQISAPLLAVASLASPQWHQRAIAAVRYAFLGVSASRELTRFQMALRDALRVWDRETTFMTGRELCDRMATLPQSPWKSLAGESQAGPRQLGSLLRAVGVVSGVHRIEGTPVQSYARADLEKAANG